MTKKEAALQYCRNGFPVIPVHRLDATGACTCRKPEECLKPGKHPRIGKWSTVTCDEAAIEQWWAEDPEANIGLRLDTLIVVDVDTHDPERNGFVSLDALQKETGAILESPCKQHSGGGGEHVLFAEVKGTAKHSGFGAGLDLLTGPGSFILVEPSMHPDGGNYHWIDEANPLTTHRDALAVAAPPDWLLYEASKPTPKAASKAAKPAANTKPANRVSVERLMTMAVDRIKGGTGRNNTGLWFFNQLRDNGYTKDEAFLSVQEWTDRANKASGGGHKYTKEEAKATWRSSYSKEAREPWAESDKGSSHADILLGLIGDFEYLKSGAQNEPYVRMSIGDHRELWRVSDRDPKVREVLTHRFLVEHDRAPSREALNTVMDTITAKCSMGPKVDVHVRFARSRDVIYLDLCDDQWRAIEITKDGWRVVDNPEVLFRRHAGARPLPVPVSGGRLDTLRPLVNCGDDSQWLLMVAWLVGVFLPEGAFVHLVLNGEQGSAKTSTCLTLVSLLDPSDAGLTSPPKDEVDATVSALHAGVLGYDNMSGCRAELSDVFCRFSTGQGYRVRTLYQNLGVTVASVKLPIILNGISSTVMRGDLAERSIMLKLPTIPPEHRLTEKDVAADFAAMHGAVLGSLLDVVALGLKNLPHTSLDRLPRMSDFALWCSSCEPGLPCMAGQFMKTYTAKMKSANLDLVEADTVASATVEWAEKRIAPGENMRISTRELLSQLNDLTLGWPKDLKYWPASAEDLAHKLTRLAPVLRASDIDVRKLKRTGKMRSHWEISRTGPQLSLPKAA